MRRVVFAVMLVLLAASSAAAQPVVFLVRHAERADAGTPAAKVAGADPDLSGAGTTRARALERVLRDAGIRTIVTTEYKRTRQTAEPLAVRLAIQATTVSSKDMATVVEKIKSTTGNVLVVGHSNTVPDVLAALGVAEPVTLGEDDYDNLFVVTRTGPPLLVRLHY